jgi:hypothetical protein
MLMGNVFIFCMYAYFAAYNAAENKDVADLALTASISNAR